MYDKTTCSSSFTPPDYQPVGMLVVNFWSKNSETSVFSGGADYQPFGMLAVGRHWDWGGYRYGFQGQEMENELFGFGNASFFKYRISDNRTGRFFSIDPLFKDYPSISNYVFSENRLIDGVELEGLEFLNKIRKNSNTSKFKLLNKDNVSFSGKGGKTWWGYNDKSDFNNNNKIDFDPANIPIDFERNSRHGEERTQFDRVEMIPTIFESGTFVYEGNVVMEFEPLDNETENTYEIGKIDSQGNEIPLIKTTTKGAGSINTDFTLNNDELLYYKASEADLTISGTTTGKTTETDEE